MLVIPAVDNSHRFAHCFCSNLHLPTMLRHEVQTTDRRTHHDNLHWIDLHHHGYRGRSANPWRDDQHGGGINENKPGPGVNIL